MGRTAYAYIDRAFGVRQLAFGQRAIFVSTYLGVGKGGLLAENWQPRAECPISS